MHTLSLLFSGGNVEVNAGETAGDAATPWTALRRSSSPGKLAPVASPDGAGGELAAMKGRKGWPRSFAEKRENEERAEGGGFSTANVFRAGADNLERERGKDAKVISVRCRFGVSAALAPTLDSSLLSHCGSFMIRAPWVIRSVDVLRLRFNRSLNLRTNIPGLTLNN